MPVLGYSAALEQFGPTELIRWCQEAEEAGFGAVMNAIAAAVGDEVFRRSPVTADIILTSLEAGRRTHEALTAHI